nr:uncharacterized protein LOC109154124 [Ipomoea batatas]
MEEVVEANGGSEAETESETSKIAVLLRRFLALQQRRAQAYARLKRGFEDYMVSGVESTYQKLCSEITVEFNDCSKQVSQSLLLGIHFNHALLFSCFLPFFYWCS